MWKKAEVWKNIKFRILVLLEIVLVCFAIIGALRKDSTVANETSMNISLLGGEYQENNGYYVDGDCGISGEWLVANGFSLEPGSYNLVLSFEALENEVASMSILADGEAFDTLRANTTSIYSGIDKQNLQFYVRDTLGEKENLRVVLNYIGEEPMVVKGIEIVRTNAMATAFLVSVIAGSLLLNCLIMLYMYMGKYSVTTEQKAVWFGIPTLALLASIPVFVDYIIVGVDFGYHVLRIEFLAKALEAGIFPVRVAPNWIYNHGYASSLFYCDTFLMLPAFLRMAGFSMIIAYNVYIVAINLATAIISYISFKGMFGKNKLVGLFGSMLYTLAPYRIYNIFNRSAVGEYTAMTFLPLICYGLYLLLKEDISDETSKTDWVVLTLGMSGIIQSHVLSCEIVAAFIAILCLMACKRVFRKHTFIQLLKAVGGTVLLNLWFLLPFLDMMASGKYKFAQNAGVNIQSRGILPANIFYTIQNAGSNSKFNKYGMWDTEPFGVGIAILLAVIVFVLFSKKCKEDGPTYYELGVVAFLIGIIGTVTSTVYFPWDALQSWNSITGTLIPMIQFPTRLTFVPTICFTVVACISALWILRRNEKIYKPIFFSTVVFCSIFFSMYQTNDILDAREAMIRIHSAEAIGHSVILGGEYMPLEATACKEYHDAWTSEGVIVEEYSKENLEVVSKVSVSENADDATPWIELPMTYYKGYKAIDADTGEVLPIEYGTNGHVRVLLDKGYEGNIHVWYNGMWYWHIAEVISIIFGAAMIYLLYRRNSYKKIILHTD